MEKHLIQVSLQQSQLKYHVHAERKNTDMLFPSKDGWLHPRW